MKNSISVIGCCANGRIYGLVLPSEMVVGIGMDIEGVHKLVKIAARQSMDAEIGLIQSWMRQRDTLLKGTNETNETNEKPND